MQSVSTATINHSIPQDDCYRIIQGFWGSRTHPFSTKWLSTKSAHPFIRDKQYVIYKCSPNRTHLLNQSREKGRQNELSVMKPFGY